MLYANGWRRLIKNLKTPAPELDMAKIKAEGFGPEAHEDQVFDPITGEEIPDDPITGTKMVI